MNNSLLKFLTLSLGLAGCLRAAATDPILPDPDAANSVPLRPLVVSEPVSRDSDDPAIWIDWQHPEKSLVLGTDKHKQGALYAFNLQGRVVGKAEGLKRPNNVDLVQGIRLGDRTLDLAAVTERQGQRLRFFSLPDLKSADAGDLVVFDGDETRAPMGLALYKRQSDGALFAIVGGKSGPSDGYLWQYRIDTKQDGTLSMKKVRSFGRYSGRKEIESIAVDHELGYVYYSDEQYGVHKYHADPDHPDATKELAVFGTAGFASDIEGISICRLNEREGYVIVSNQQADTFRIFPREGTSSDAHHHPFLASVRLSTRESDGSDLSLIPLPGFPGGLFVAMSADRTFQFYAWKDIAAAAGLKSP